MKKLSVIIGGLVVLLVAVAVGGVAVLSSMDFNEYKGVIAEQAKAATGRDLVIAGDLDLEISLNPALAVRGVTFANADWGSRPEMAKLDRLEAQVALMPLFGGTVQVERLVLEGLDLLAETDKQGKGNWEFGKAEAATPAKPATEGGAAKLPVVNLIHLKDVKVTYKDGQTGETLSAVVDSLELGADSASSPLTLRLAGAYNGLAYNVGGRLCSVDELAGGKPCNLTLEGASAGVSFGVDGSIMEPLAAKGLKLALAVDVPKPNDTLSQAAIAVPALKDAGPVPALPVSVKGTLKDGDKSYAVDGLALTIGGSDLSGNLAVALGGKRPRLDATLASTLLDIDEIAPAKEEKAAPAKAEEKKDAKGAKRVFPADPLPLDGLKAADAKVSFKGKAIKASGMTVSDVAVDLSLMNGKLVVKPLGAVLATGKIAGAVTLDGNAAVPSLDVDLTAKQVDYGKLLVAMGQELLAEGTVDLMVDIRGAGDSVRALMAGLNGKTRIVAEKGKINSNALNIVSADVGSALPFLSSEGDKDLKCAVVHFDIKNGMADARAIVIETGGLSVIGTGDVNLKTEGLALRVEPRAKKTSVAKLAEVPVNVGGVLAEPDIKPDTVETAKAVVGTVGTVVGAVATGGVSLLGQAAVSEATLDETDYCTPALAGKKVVPGELKKAEAEEKGTEPAQESTVEKVGDKVKGLGESLGGGLKGLFGN